MSACQVLALPSGGYTLNIHKAEHSYFKVKNNNSKCLKLSPIPDHHKRNWTFCFFFLDRKLMKEESFTEDNSQIKYQGKWICLLPFKHTPSVTFWKRKRFKRDGLHEFNYRDCCAKLITQPKNYKKKKQQTREDYIHNSE